MNSQTENLFGYAREELIGEPIETLIPERYRSAHRGAGTGTSPIRGRGPWAPA